MAPRSIVSAGHPGLFVESPSGRCFGVLRFRTIFALVPKSFSIDSLSPLCLCSRFRTATDARIFRGHARLPNGRSSFEIRTEFYLARGSTARFGCRTNHTISDFESRFTLFRPPSNVVTLIISNDIFLVGASRIF